MNFFFEPKYSPIKIKVFLSKKNLNEAELEDLYLHSKHIILAKLIEHYLKHLDSHSDRVYFLSMVHSANRSEEIFNFISIRIRNFSFAQKFAEIEEEIISILAKD